MVEVMVAVMVVSIVMAMFGKVAGASAQMYSRSLEVIRKTEAFNEAYYKTASIDSRTEAGRGLKLTDQEGHSIALPRGIVEVYEDESLGMKRYSIGLREDNGSESEME